MNKFTTIAALTARIRTHKSEQEILLKQLDCWASAQRACFDVEDVMAFTFRDEFVKPMTISERRLSMIGVRASISADTHHNAVRLVDGTVQPIFPVARPPKI